ncbi:MAG: ATP-binding protein [Candidatus Electrothrix sp. GM3_4]|nr:ATP-binding protein [Candidatus Electrothrix sp. GM3_4]
MNAMLLNSFQPLRLRIEGNGPFPENPYEIDFTDEDGQPCNIFLLMSENGMGKTTVLEIMSGMMEMLGKQNVTSYGVAGLDNGEFTAQWDILVHLFEGKKKHIIVLSLLAGKFIVASDSRFIWPKNKLQKHGAEKQEIIEVLLMPSLPPTPHYTFVNQMENLFREWKGPGSEYVESFGLPSLLHFSAYRNIVKIAEQGRHIAEPDSWGYKSVRTFSAQNTSWESSLDNVLVWMKWLDDGRLEEAITFINKRVFQDSTTVIKGVRKMPPEAIVVSNGQEHTLDRLSSGEKNLVDLFLKIKAHCTRNSIILIDEPEIHLHPNWQKRLMKHLRQFAQEHPGMTIIIATHSIEMLRAFSFEHKEKGLRKGGEIIEENME